MHAPPSTWSGVPAPVICMGNIGFFLTPAHAGCCPGDKSGAGSPRGQRREKGRAERPQATMRRSHRARCEASTQHDAELFSA